MSFFDSMVGFNISLAKLDVSVAYAVWSALGTTLVTAVGFLFFGETLDLTKLLYLSMIVCGVVGLNLRSPST
jgi:small multidrug resistance pump